MKEKLKSKAISLRKSGLSYSQILQQIPVAKSTLSLWLRPVGLSVRQRQRLTEIKLLAAKRGGEVRKRFRLEETIKIKEQARREISPISQKELFLLGTIL